MEGAPGAGAAGLGPREWAAARGAVAAVGSFAEALEAFRFVFPGRAAQFRALQRGLLSLLRGGGEAPGPPLGLPQRLAALYVVCEAYRGHLPRASAPLWQNALLPAVLQGMAAPGCHPAEKAFLGQLLGEPCPPGLPDLTPAGFLLALEADGLAAPPAGLGPQLLDATEAMPPGPPGAPEEQPGGSSAEERFVQAVRRAARAPLFPAELDSLIREVPAFGEGGTAALSDPAALLPPVLLPGLVEHNVGLAMALLLQLHRSSAPMGQIYGTFCVLELSVRGLELADCLLENSGVPGEVFCLFLSNMMRACRGLRDQGRQQGRFAKLLCNLCRKAARQHLRDLQDNVLDMRVEIETFCIEFSQVREALELFRHLRSM